MSQTFSTRDRDLNRGQLYSSRVTSVTSLPQGPALPERTVTFAVAPQAVAPAPAAAPAPTPAPEQRFSFALSAQGIVPAPPTGSTAAGSVAIVGRPGLAHTVTATLNSFKPHRDPAIRPALWLIHDLTVPADLAPADLAALPRGVGLTGNRPGAVFTVDGNPATSGATILQQRTPPHPKRGGGVSL
ncbi:MAG TPA: hypothetical protein VNT01_12095 [Symbiobacteriaceae bacterium]|nr:hypothetical protein [Symbiobacteriaceae bacterium]